MARPVKPPFGQGLQSDSDVQPAMAWVAWFQSVSDRLDALENENAALRARLLAAGIP